MRSKNEIEEDKNIKNYYKIIVLVLILFSNLFAQIIFLPSSKILFPKEFESFDFFPDNISSGPSGFYLLDNKSRQIAYLSNDGKYKIEGGFGSGTSAFIDPVCILISNLYVWVVERTNNMIHSLDYKLNFVKSSEFEPIYPEFAAVDSWDQIYLYSNLDRMLYRFNPFTEHTLEFIDLSVWSDQCGNIEAISVLESGDVFLFCKDQQLLFQFNRVGRLIKISSVENLDVDFVTSYNSRILLLNKNGNGSVFPGAKEIKLPVTETILGISSYQGGLSILHSDHIIILREQIH